MKRTKVGEFLDDRSANKASISRKTGISQNRLSELSNNPEAKLRADELFYIAQALGVNPCDLLNYVCTSFKSLKPKSR